MTRAATGLDATVDLFMPLTAVLREALPRITDQGAQADLLFLERWELVPRPDMAQVLRVRQIRRANPDLARAIRAEVAALQPAAPTLR